MLHAVRVVLCASKTGVCIKISLIARSRDVGFWSETLVSCRRHISRLMIPSFGRPMQLLRGEVDRFPGLAV